MNIIHQADQQAGLLVSIEVGELVTVTQVHQASRGFFRFRLFYCCYIRLVIILSKISVDQLAKLNLDFQQLWIILKL